MANHVHSLEEFKALSFEKLNDNPLGVIFTLVDPDIFEVTDEQTWEKVSTTANDKHLKLVDWHLVSMTIDGKRIPPSLLSSCDEGEYTTSQITYMAPDRSAVVTKSGSLYRLGKPSETGEPTLSQLLFWVYSLRHWGGGELVKDWPEVFF